MVPNKKLLVNAAFQATHYRKKELCVDNKVRETIGDEYCPTCRNEKCVYLSTNKTTSFYDCKKCKACCHVLNIPSWEPKSDNYLVWRWLYTLLRKKDDSQLRKRKAISIFEEISPPIISKHIRTWTKKAAVIPVMV